MEVPPTMTKDTFNAAVSQAVAAYPDLATRIQAAAEIVARHLANPSERIITATIKADGLVIYRVKGSKPGTVYTVTADGTCTCPDHVKRGVKACKHVLAVRLLEFIMGRAHSAPVLVTVTRPLADNARMLADVLAESMGSAVVTELMIARAQAARRVRGRFEWAEEV